MHRSIVLLVASFDLLLLLLVALSLPISVVESLPFFHQRRSQSSSSEKEDCHCCNKLSEEEKGSTSSAITIDKTMSGVAPVKQTIRCACGKVKLSVDSPSALRFVCYCKDCRGYYQALNSIRNKNNARLDAWGGVDHLQLYPSEIQIQQGRENVSLCKIRDKSPIVRAYASCCDTPLFVVGGMSAMLNANLVASETDKPEVKFRIIGRNAYKEAAGNVEAGEKLTRPPMSWSVPLAWFWTMPKRIQKDKMTPSPIPEADAKTVPVLPNFREG